jgi:uncharacterized membrane protein
MKKIFKNFSLIIIATIAAFFYGRQQKKLENEKKKNESLAKDIQETREAKKDIARRSRDDKLDLL